LIWH